MNCVPAPSSWAGLELCLHPAGGPGLFNRSAPRDAVGLITRRTQHLQAEQRGAGRSGPWRGSASRGQSKRNTAGLYPIYHAVRLAQRGVGAPGTALPHTPAATTQHGRRGSADAAAWCGHTSAAALLDVLAQAPVWRKVAWADTNTSSLLRPAWRTLQRGEPAYACGCLETAVSASTCRT